MKRLSLVLALTVLGGCATVDSNHEPVAAIEQAQVNLPLSQLTYQPVTVNGKTVRLNQELNQYSQWTDAGGVSSPVASWKLPESGIYEFELWSFVSRNPAGQAKTFIPEIWLLDASYQPLQKLSADELSYNYQSMLVREYLSQEFVIDNRYKNHNAAVYLVALATDASMERVIQVTNFGEEYARARRINPIQPGDVFAEPVTEGALRLSVKPLKGHRKISAEMPMVLAADHASATAQVVPAVLDNNLKQLSQDFISGIESALAEGDVQRAMQMRNEAQVMNARLQKYFSENYGQVNTSSTPAAQQKPANAMEGSSNEKLSQAFLSELDQELQKGNAQTALAILDLSNQLVRDVDAAF